MDVLGGVTTGGDTLLDVVATTAVNAALVTGRGHGPAGPLDPAGSGQVNLT